MINKFLNVVPLRVFKKIDLFFVLFLSIACGGNGNQSVDSYTISTLIGTGVAGNLDGDNSLATLNGPADVTVASDGVIWMTDENNHSVRSIDPLTQTIVTESNTSGVSGFSDAVAELAQMNSQKVWP